MSETTVDTGHRTDAQLILEGTAFRLRSWQIRAQVVDALVRRPQSDREHIIEECVIVQVQILDAKTEIIMAIAEAKGFDMIEPERWREFETAADEIIATVRRVEQRARSRL